MSYELNKYNQEILAVLKCVFLKKIKSDNDKQKLDKIARKLLNEYYFVKHNENIGIGTCIVYIDCEEIKKIPNVNINSKKLTIKNTSNIKFTGNGYVIDDTNDELTLTSKQTTNRWTIKKKNSLIFKKLTKNELLKMSFEAFLHDN